MDVQIRPGTTDDAASLAALLIEVNDLHAAVLPDVFASTEADDETVRFLTDWIAEAGTHLPIAEGAFDDGSRRQVPACPTC